MPRNVMDSVLSVIQVCVSAVGSGSVLCLTPLPSSSRQVLRHQASVSNLIWRFVFQTPGWTVNWEPVGPRQPREEAAPLTGASAYLPLHLSYRYCFCGYIYRNFNLKIMKKIMTCTLTTLWNKLKNNESLTKECPKEEFYSLSSAGNCFMLVLCWHLNTFGGKSWRKLPAWSLGIAWKWALQLSLCILDNLEICLRDMIRWREAVASHNLSAGGSGTSSR